MPPRPRPAPATVPWDGESVARSPLAVLVDAAVDAGQVDRRALGHRLGLDADALREALDDPARLGRAARDELATALGVDRAVVRRACDAAPASPDAELPEAVPRTIVELLERTIAAVADDPLGRRIRMSLLTTAHTAAAEAGRGLPPEVHELRARVLRGLPAWVGDGGTFVDAPTPEDDRALIDAVAAAVGAAQRNGGGNGGGYDDLFAPLHDDAMDELLRRSTAAVRPAALGTTSACVVTPPLFGRHLVVCSADATPDQRRVALRRALAHVLCGHVGEHAPLPFPAPAAVTRAADVFALTDLVPFWQLDAWRRGPRGGWRSIMSRVADTAAALAGDWDEARAAEAGRLRVLLYRERKI